jgi:Ca2+-binding RTX toxin-like protein
MSRVWRVFLILCLCLQILGVAALPSRVSADPDADSDAIVDGLKGLATVLDGLGAFEELGDTIPLTALSPSDNDALNLDELFDGVDGVFSGLSSSSVSGLKGAIEGRGGDYDGVTVTFDSVSVTDVDGFVDLSFTMSASRSITPQIAFSQDSVNLAGGELPIELGLSTTLAFQLDKNKVDTIPDPTAFYLVEEPTINVAIDVNVFPMSTFASLLGFAEVQAGGNAAFNIDIAVDFADPDEDGRITVEEWTTTSLVDLVDVDYTAGSSVNFTLTLDTELISGTPDASITLEDSDLGDGLNPATIELGVLGDFTNIQPAEVLGGLNQMAAALLGGQNIGDLQLPFLQESLGDTFVFAEPLIDFLEGQGEAAIICGTNGDTDPPTGSVWNLPAGTTVYCQAITLENPTSVNWTITNGTVDANGDNVNTVGTNPSENAEFTLTEGGCPKVKVEFTFPSDSPGQTHVVTSLFRTAGEMGEKLAEIAGFDETLAVPSYDPETHTLSYRLQKSMDPVAVNGTLNFGSQLQAATNLTGLGPGEGADVKIDPSNVTLDVTFGIILVDELDDILPGANFTDRFFLRVDPDEPEFQADASLIVNNVALEGRLGFLEVEAVGDAEPTGTIFSIDRSDGSKPMLELDFNAPGIDVTGNPTIPNAILLTRLLDELGDRIEPSCNVKMSAGLRVSAFVGNHTVELASGKVGIDWPDVFGDTCVFNTSGLSITMDTDFIQNLKAFDIDPDNYMALLSVILDNLDALVTGLDTLPEGSYLDTKLPLVGTSPRDLITQFDTLQDIIDYIRTHPPYSLQELEEMLEYKLDLDPDVLELELAELKPGIDKELVIRLGYGICTGNNTVIDPCEDGDKVVNKVEKRLNLGLGDSLAGLVALEADSSFQLEYAARAQLDLGIPLDGGDAFVVVDSTGVEVEAGVAATAVNLSANVGPLTLNLGNNVSIVSGTHDGGDAQNLTDSSTNFIDLKVPVGATLKNLTTNTTGTVTAVSTHTLNWGAGNWTNGNEYEVYGVGLAMMGASFTLRNESMSDILTINDFLFNGDLTAELDGIDCDCGTADSIVLEGDACASLSVGLENPGYLGTIGFVVPDLTDPAYDVTVPEDLVDQILNAALDWTLWLKSLPELLEKVEHMLNGGSDISLPLVGKALNAGADVVGTINDDFVTPLVDKVDELEGLATAGNISEKIQTQIFEAIGPPGAGLLQDANDNGVTKEDITVTCSNETGICADNDSVLEIDDIQVTFYIGQDLVDGAAPFDIGLPGLPIGAQGNFTAEVDWKLLVDFGLSRSEGPYIVTGGSNHTDAELQLSATVSLGQKETACEGDPVLPTDPPGLQGYNTTRCLEGHLGFLQVTLRDGADDDGNSTPDNDDDDASKLSLTTYLDLGSDSGDRLTLGQLVTSSADLDLGVEADANIDMRFRTGIRSGQSAGFPSVLGTFHLSWNWSTDDPELSAPDIEFKNLYLNSGTFIGQFLEPVVGQIKGVTSTLKPVIDTLQAPVPVLTQLAELVGEAPVTMISLLKAVAGSDLSLVDSLIAFINFANNLPTGDETIWIPLGKKGSERQPGSFAVNAALAQAGPLTPDQAGSLVETDTANAGSDLMEEVGDADPGGTSERPETFGVPGLSFPFMKDAKNIFALLMGQDVVLVHYDTGIMRASTGVSYDFGPIMVGPIPISIGISGSIAVEGRFAIGYDTSGLRKLLGDEGTLTDLFDGIYLDDLDARGIDVPEVKLIGTVAASASVDLVIVSAGVEGGIRLTVGLNLNDSPNPDGKLRIEEIVRKLDNPICLFDVEGSLDAFLSAYVKIGFAFFSKTFRFTVVKVTLLDFCAGCSEPPPELAHVDGGTLYLHIGTRANQRNIHEGEIHEKFVVRQLTPNVSEAVSGNFSVTAFGVYMEYPNVNRIEADADNGNDIISLEPGTDSEGNTIPFTAPSLIYGGDDNDQLRGGSGRDELHGGAGSDTISGGGGNDTIYGDGDDDVLSGDNGNDEIDGGAGDDAITGGPGSDTLKGGADDDEISGGPGTDDNPDLADTIEGGAGNDNIEGNHGDDILYGDEVLSCSAAGAGSGGNDQILGGSGDDTIRGGAGDDVLIGEEGDDEICGNAGDDFIDGDDNDASTEDGNDKLYGGDNDDEMHGRGGEDDMYGQDNADTMYGDAGEDEMYGNTGDDTMWGGIDDDYMEGNEESDTMHGDAGQDEMYGDAGEDEMYGDAGEDYMEGNSGDDFMRGGTQNDEMYGNADNDEMYGDSGRDEMYGNVGDDTMRGGIGDDYMEGNQDVDTMYGDAGQDDMIGGSSSSGTSDVGDIMRGNAQQDVMCGDNAIITRPGGTDSADGTVIRNVTLLDLNSPIGGPDEMHGDAGNDDMYGGPEADTMHGNAGDDYMEGNPGSEVHMYGDAGQDDMMGGTSQTGSTYPDGGDTISGGDGAGGVTDNDYDVILGDNGIITRPLNATGQWIINTFNDAVTRNITLYDVGEVGSPSPAGTSGNDTLYGEANDDIMYGQGGNDEMYGGSGDDYMEGNAGAETLMHGNEGNDDMVGGTGRINDDPPLGVDGRLDDGDTMHGDAGFDVMAGDNAIITRVLDATGQWLSNTYNDGIQHERIILLDVDSPDVAVVSGEDIMYGDDHDDVMYGQGSDDEMYGGTGHDYMEGNADDDTMEGNAGQDDMVGGTGRLHGDPEWGIDGRFDGDDIMYGENATSGNGIAEGDGADVMLGDNSIIIRPLTDGQWTINTFNDAVTRVVFLRDVATMTYAPDPKVSGNDTMWGNDNDDIMYGQGGEDEMHGGAGDDYMEGNAASDEMYGDCEDDDMIGGTGRINEDPPEGTPGRIDESTLTREVTLGSSTVTVPLGDTMYGGEGSDVMLGDNAIITRPLDGGGWITLEYSLFVSSNGISPRHETSGDGSRIDREVYTIDMGPGRVAGSDLMYGGPGDDDIYGQFDDSMIATSMPAIGDEMYGEEGEDAMAGDQGLFENWVVGTPTQYIEPKEPFIDDDIFIQDTLFRELEIEEDQIHIGGDDRMLGGDDGDWMHGGAGNDLMNGNSGNDRLFGDDGDDVMWGGYHHDHLWGGWGNDYLDVKPRPAMTVGKNNKQETIPADPDEWFEYAEFDNYQDIDFIYGGWDQDAMQANVADEGPIAGDRLIDWVGAYNVYYLCPGVYGEFVSTRDLSPHMIKFLQELAEGDGALEPKAKDSSGFVEVAMVFAKEGGQNSHPPHPDNVGHFTCS